MKEKGGESWAYGAEHRVQAVEGVGYGCEEGNELGLDFIVAIVYSSVDFSYDRTYKSSPQMAADITILLVASMQCVCTSHVHHSI